MIYNLVDRVILLSHPTFHKENLDLCTKLLLKNGYPSWKLFRETNNRLLFNNKYVPNSKFEQCQ